MQLKELKSSSNYHRGYGAGSGEVINEEYECPCGKGKVFYEKDNIPGFRDSNIHTNCNECNDKYNFGRGTATLK
jgi:hypothetical protein